MTLNPVLRIDTQMIEAVLRMTPSRALKRAGAPRCARHGRHPDPDERLKSYPHQFSGGMRQRVAIAIALLHQPDFIIRRRADAALDVTIQAQILAEVQKLVADRDTALVWITHDLAVVSLLATTSP